MVQKRWNVLGIYLPCYLRSRSWEAILFSSHELGKVVLQGVTRLSSTTSEKFVLRMCPRPFYEVSMCSGRTKG